MKNILCYGDSNTWGYVPGSINWDTFSCERFAYDQRWTGLLQQKLGNGYRVIKELCEQKGCAYLDLTPHITYSESDGIHIEQQDQVVMADLLAPMVQELVG